MIALIDYGAGNLRSVFKALKAAGGDVVQTDDPDVILKAEKVVLPGVGAFQKGMEGLADRGLIPAIKKVAESQTPLLGICLGMQVLFDIGSERGQSSGLSLISGSVDRFPSKTLAIPQTGWNQLKFLKSSPLFAGVETESYVYFNHSFFCNPERTKDILCQTEYGIAYASAVHKDNLYGVQFHPEKSQYHGLRILENFTQL